MALVPILENQEVTLTMTDGIPMPMTMDVTLTAPVVAGETYTVAWNGTDYVCVAALLEQGGAGLVMLGNAIVTGGEDDGIPFACQFVSSEITGGDEMFIIISMYDTAEVTYTVGIYQGKEEEKEANIVLKDRSGNNIEYPSVRSIKVRTSDGGTREYIHGEIVEKTVAPDFSGGDMEVTAADGAFLEKVTVEKPETLLPENIRNGVEVAGVAGEFIGDTEEVTVELALADGNQTVTPSADGKVISGVTITKPANLVPENIAKDVDIAGVVGTLTAETEETTVNLDFSNGDMEITPTDDKFFSKVNIPVPGTLIPENIAEGVNIAGIIGTLAAGGGGRVVSVTQKATPTSNTFTLTHGLGVVPDIVFVANTSLATTIANSTLIAIGRSTAAKNAGVAIPNNHRWYRSNTYFYCSGSGDKCIDTDDTSVSIPIINANEETVTFNRLATTEQYEFFCIGGLV